jgi:hypothetical protein
MLFLGDRQSVPARLERQAEANEEADAMLSDTLPAGFECGVLNSQVKAGDTVAIVGPGLIRRLPASAVPVIAAAPEQKDQHDDQEDSAHDLFPPFSSEKKHETCQSRLA